MPIAEEFMGPAGAKIIQWPVVDDAEAEKRMEELREAHHSDVLLKGVEDTGVAESVAIPVREEVSSVDATVVPAEEAVASSELVSQAVSGNVAKVLVHVEGEAEAPEIQTEAQKQFEALEEEIEQEINEIDKMIKSHRKTVQMRAMNKWTHEEEWTKLTAALDQAKADMDAAIDLANGNGHEQEALDQLKKIKASLDISVLEVKVLPELEEETVDVKVPVAEKKKKQGEGPKKKPEGKKKAVAKQETRESEEVVYERLERMAEDDGAYHTVLGAIAAGLRTMKETVPGIEKRKDELSGRIAEAIALKLEHPIVATGERLGWSADETGLFAREIVRKGIEKFLK